MTCLVINNEGEGGMRVVYDNSKFEVLKSNSWKITSFSKTMSLQREQFLTMFYTINLSPLLVIKKGFTIIIILSNYQLVSTAFKTRSSILKTLDTNGNCQRPVFSLGVSQHMHKITNL